MTALIRKLEKIWKVRLTWFNFSYSLMLILGLAFVLNLGPSLQQTTLNLLTGPEVEIYKSQYGSDLIKFTSLNDWLFNVGLLNMFPISVGLLFFLRKQRKARDVFLISIVYLFGALSILDFILFLLNESPNREADFFGSIASNLAGSPLLATYVVIIGRISEIILRFTPNLKSLRYFLVLITAGISGIILSIFFHQIYSLFFDPKLINIQAVSHRHVDGFYATKKISEDLTRDSEKNKKPPGFFQKKTSVPNRISLLTDNAKIEFNNDLDEFKYKTEVYVYTGCMPSAVHAFSKKDTPLLSINELKTMSFKLDEGFNEIIILANKYNTLQINDHNKSFFWVRESKKDNHIDYTQFLLNTNLTLENTLGSFELLVGVFLIEKEERNFRPSTKEENIDFLANGQKYNFVLKNKHNIDYNAKLECIPVRPNRQSHNRLELNDMNFGAMFRIVISPLMASSRSFLSNGSEITVSTPKSVTLRVNEIPNQEFSNYFNEGIFTGFSFRGTLKEFKVNDQKKEVGAIDELELQNADLKVKINSAGELLMDGTAKAAHRNAERMNQTRWERLDASVKLLLLSGAFGLISTVFLFLSKCLTSNSRVRI